MVSSCYFYVIRNIISLHGYMEFENRYSRSTSKYVPAFYITRLNSNKQCTQKHNPFMVAYEINLKRELTLKIKQIK